jgi:hypothetical protein
MALEGDDSHASPELCITWWLPSSLTGLGTMGHTMAPEPLGAERQGSRATERVAVLEPSHLGSRDLELRDMW